jgi:hypothetical protein
LDLKKAFRKQIGNDIKIRVHLAARSGPTSHAKGYALVMSDDDAEKAPKALGSPSKPSIVRMMSASLSNTNVVNG